MQIRYASNDKIYDTKFMCHKLWGKETIVKQAFSPLQIMLSKGLFPRVVKSQGCVEKSEGLICLQYMTPLYHTY